MGRAAGVEPSSTIADAWSPHGGAVAFLPGERAAAERIARRLFERPLKAREYAGLAGAPRNAYVEIGALAGQLYIEMGDAVAASYRGHYYIHRAAGRVVVLNDGFQIRYPAMQGRGLGLRIFQRQAAAAAALGVARIELVAGRRRSENGYYTWPRFGFDAPLPARLQPTLPLGLRDAETVLDLMGCEAGRLWWREHGVPLGVAFDLASGSRCWAVLRGYVRVRREKILPN